MASEKSSGAEGAPRDATISVDSSESGLLHALGMLFTSVACLSALYEARGVFRHSNAFSNIG